MKKEFFIIILILLLTSSVYAFSVGKFSIEALNFCGDGSIGDSEECDLIDLGFKTCLTLGYDSGAISCTGSCTFDESSCIYSNLDKKDTDIHRECNDEIDNDDDGKIDFPNDPGCSNFLDDSESDSICDPYWEVGEWGECIEFTQIRRNIDVNHCFEDYILDESQECGNKIIIDEIDKKKKFLDFFPREIIPAIIIGLIIIIWFIIILIKRRKDEENKKKKKR